MRANQVVTFGCRLNTYESEVIQQLAEANGMEGAIFINTCAVTSEAERQARQSIRKLRRENPEAPIIVTGCSAQIRPNTYSDMDEVSAVWGNTEKMQATSYAQFASPDVTPRVQVSNIQKVRETANHLVSGFEGKARAFIQVQNGCDYDCTFCTIPAGRGKSRSVPIGAIVEQVKQLIHEYPEVVLTGVDIASYGRDLPGTPTLGVMAKRLLSHVPELQRLRLSSLDPANMDDHIWELIEHEPRLMPHIHLSAQAGDTLILKRMKRRHTRDDLLHVCEKIHKLRPDAVIGADFIAGFPTETDEHFQNTLNSIDEGGMTLLHVFPYSSRPGTPAARIPQLPRDVVKSRAAMLRQKSFEQEQKEFARHVSTVCETLVEQHVDDTFSIGKTSHFLPIRFPRTDQKIVRVLVEGFDGKNLIGNHF